MRRFGYLFVVLGLLGAAGWLVGFSPAAILNVVPPKTQDGESWKLDLVPRAAVSIGYLAPTERWLTFSVLPGSTQIRLLSNGSFRDFSAAKAMRASNPTKRWQYALEIEVLDNDGNSLLKRVHHYRSDVAEVMDPDGKVFTPSYYLRARLTPSSSGVINLNLAGLPSATKLRIRSASIDPDLADVLVRAYFLQHNSDRSVEHRWGRLNDEQKLALSKGSVYSPELLNDEEKRNLLLTMWRPTGPQGVQDIDYQARELYIVQDTEGSEPVDDPIVPAGIISAPGQLAVFTIPEKGGTLSLRAEPITPVTDAGTKPAEPILLNARWYGNNTFARENFTLKWEGPGKPSVRKLAGGLVEVEAPFPMALRGFMEIDGKNVEVTPETLYQRLFVADKQKPVVFNIAHEDGRPTPIRLDLRHLYPASGKVVAPVMHYEFLHADGRIAKSGDIKLNVPLSRYDQVEGQPVGTRISDFAEYFFSVPSGVNQIRVSATEQGGEPSLPVLVELYTRPATLVYQVRAPEDQFGFGSRGVRDNVWFPVRPVDYEALMKDNRTQLVAVQSRPPEDKPALVSGKFVWEDFLPQGTGLTGQLITPREPGMPLREESLISTFEPLTLNRSQTYEFPVYLGTRELTPSLIWDAADNFSFEGTVIVDGVRHHTFQGSGPYGETKLPPLIAGRHAIKLEIAATAGDKRVPRFYLNQIRPSNNAYVRRLATRVEKEISFDIERTSRLEETVTARLFQPAGWRRRTVLLARVEGPSPAPLTPMPGWVVGERRFDVRSDPSFSAPVFDTRGVHTDAGQPVYIPFPADAPLGHYRLFFRVEQGPAGYLAVSRITPDITPQRRVLNEPEVRSRVENED
ncbi:MAG: hypothetical protein V4568_09030 [Pseudomonadota bacterium]